MEIALGGNLLYALGAVTTVILTTFVVTTRWRSLHLAIGPQDTLRWIDFYYGYMWGRIVALFLPQGVGEIAGRSIWGRTLVSRPGGRFVYSSTLDVLFDLLLVFALLPSAILYVTGQAWFLVAALASILALFLLSTVAFSHAADLVAHLGTWLERRLSDWEPERSLARTIQKSALHIAASFGWLKRISWQTATAAVLLTITKYSLLVGRSWFAALAIGLRVPVELLFYSTVLIQITQIVPLTPGGWGVTELGWYGVLRLAGVNRSESAAFAIAQRVYIVLALLLGLGGATLASMIIMPRKDEPATKVNL
jgi:uncharacterized protein (TIRG00374 family)